MNLHRTEPVPQAREWDASVVFRDEGLVPVVLYHLKKSITTVLSDNANNNNRIPFIMLISLS
jgi:hypothetical protein